MDIGTHIRYWLDGAVKDLEVARRLLASGDNAWCLFIGHLVLEKLLKAIFVQVHKTHPPRTHNLLLLAKKLDLELSDEQERFLDVVNDFNIEARYPDYRNEVHKLCTEEFTRSSFNRIEEAAKWLRSQIKY